MFLGVVYPDVDPEAKYSDIAVKGQLENRTLLQSEATKGLHSVKSNSWFWGIGGLVLTPCWAIAG